MSTVTIRVASIEEVKKSTLAALKGDKSAKGEFITFLTFDDLHKTLTPKKMAILNAMAGAGSMSIRELSRRLNRDFRAVHRDITILLKSGVIDHDEDDKIIFPFTDVHFDFNLEGKVA